MNTLSEKWNTLKTENPNLRIRNAAEQLGVGEAELLVTKVGQNVIRLRSEFQNILLEIETLGKVMALTRNNECVHERKGVYTNGDFSNFHVGLFVNEDIDLRIFLSVWDKVFAVTEESEHGTRKSLQFFAKNGDAIHKIYLTKDSNEIAYQKLIEKYKSENQTVDETFISNFLEEKEKSDSEIDIERFRKSWKELKDTHDFFSLLKKFGVTRTQALRLAPSEYYAQKIDNQASVKLLELAAKTKTPIMVFVGNIGNIQIHTGKIRRTMWHREWFNVMDPDFNLHLDMSKVDSTYIVRKPSENDVVTSVEVFNQKGEMVVQFFGKRKSGIPELEEWRKIVQELA